MKTAIIEALLEYPFRLSACEIARRMQLDSDLDKSFDLFEELLNLTREGLVRRYTQNQRGLFVLNLERPTAHAPVRLLNMLIICAAGAPLYTVVDAAAVGDDVTTEDKHVQWHNVDAHIMGRVVILSAKFLSDIYQLNAWFPWRADTLSTVITELKSHSIKAEYFLEEPDGKRQDS